MVSASALNSLLRRVVDAGASDVHLKVGQPPVVRLDGELEPLAAWPASPPALEEVLALVGASSRSRLAAFEARASSTPPTRRTACRASASTRSASAATISLAFRVIPREVPDFESLRLPPGVEKLAEEHRGLILVTGATGVGKTTTLAAMLGHINRRAGSTSSRSRTRSSSSTRTSGASSTSARSGSTPSRSTRRSGACCARTRT